MRYILLSILFVYADARDISSLMSKIDYLKSETLKSFKEIKVDYDPFAQAKKIFIKEKKIKTVVKQSLKTSLTLVTVLNDKAFINSKWYKKNDKLYGYKIVYIGNDKVMLRKQNKIKYLQIKKTKSLLKVEQRK